MLCLPRSTGGRVASALSLAALFSAACSPEAEQVPEFSEHADRDSSGVTIVESTFPAWGEGETWSLSEEPVLSIGAVDGPEEYLLYRSSSAIRLEDGRIVVSHGGSQELRFYDSQGRYLDASGTDGEGPGEFRSVGFIWRLGQDSLAVLDYRLLRVSFFDTNGVFGRSTRIGEGGHDLPFPFGMFSDGTFLALTSSADDGEYEADLGSIRDMVEHRLYNRDGILLRPLVTLPGNELYRAVQADGSGVTTRPHHGLRSWTLTGADTWFYGGSEAYEIQEWSREGELLRIIRLVREPRAMPPEVVADWEARLQGMNPRAKAFWTPIPLPDLFPAYEQIIQDRAGNLWVAEYPVLEEPPLWQVFTPDGHWLGSVATPPGGRISEIGSNYVLGTWKDEMDIETVRMYSLEKPEGD